jgi:hypothetical protein
MAGTLRSRPGFSRGGAPREYIRRALPFTVLALLTLISVAGLVWALGLSDHADFIWSVLFVGLGALTSAHARVMKSFLMRPIQSRSPAPLP